MRNVLIKVCWWLITSKRNVSYSLTKTEISPSKAPVSHKRENSKFKYFLSKAQVINKHSTGILKVCCASVMTDSSN
ncbi:hypothetical protein VP01_897g3 [Puccinia sorghi]|uniref:Uncharacterized protein n=1 Tax=Puccinia sorghi TaxID=27349 RepID=A0A0L6UA14_9BASI|nr:hypothetical protein VP01_897g3 [Puccinia sorghi]